MSDKKKIFDFGLFSRIFTFVRPYKARFYGSLFMAIALAFATIVRPTLIMDVVNAGAGKQLHTSAFLRWLLGNPGSVRQFIVAVSVFQIAFIVVETAVRFAFAFLTSWLGQAVVKDMRITVFDKVLHLNLKQFDTTPIGTLTTRTINDIESINDVFSDGLLSILADMLTIIVVLVAMLLTDWQLTLISLIPLPLMFVATYYFKESVNKSFIKVRNAVAALNAFVQEHITGMHIVQAFSAEEREFKRFEQINNEHKKANIKSIFAYSIFFPVVEVVLALSTGLLVWWAADKALGISEGTAIAGKLTAFLLYISAIFRPLRFIADKFNTLQMGMIAAERVFKVLDNPDFIQQQGQHAPQTVKGKINFDHVWFAYEQEHYVLKDIHFEAQPGQTIALVGHTGSGKTSIISLLNRLYHINKGAIRLDDVNIEDYRLDMLRKNIGIVLQDVFLFSGSVMDNITLYNPDIPKSKVVEVAQLIGVHNFIMQLPGNYDYNVMERGNTLSLGQRQLIAFIRALLYNPSVLILDEATSSIDSESELLIQHAIEKLVADRTAIVIAHRLSTIRKAHKILVLDKGEIVETGTHDELLALGGFYSKLHHQQFLEKDFEKVK